jgi:hypothetical protein
MSLLVAGLVLAGVTDSRAAAAPSGLLRDYRILGLESVTLRRGVSVAGGDVGCNGSGGTLSMMARSRVAGMAAANTVRLGTGAGADELFCSGLEPFRPTTATCKPLQTPFVPESRLADVQVNPGDQRIDVPAGAVIGPVPPGPFGVVRILRGGRLTLVGGDYDFRSIWIGRGGQLVCETDCNLRVAGRVVLKQSAFLGGEQGRNPVQVRLDVASNLGRRASVRVYRRSVMDARVYAPHGGITLGMNGSYRGSFIGRTVYVWHAARIEAPAEPPPAEG